MPGSEGHKTASAHGRPAGKYGQPEKKPEHTIPNIPEEEYAPDTMDGQPQSVKQSGEAGRRVQAINQNLPQAQGSRQPDRGGKKH